MYNIIDYSDIMQVEDTTRWDAPPEDSQGYDNSEYDGDAIEEQPTTDTP